MALLVPADHERVYTWAGDLAEILCRVLYLEADQDLAAITTLDADLAGEAACKTGPAGEKATAAFRIGIVSADRKRTNEGSFAEAWKASLRPGGIRSSLPR